MVTYKVGCQGFVLLGVWYEVFPGWTNEGLRLASLVFAYLQAKIALYPSGIPRSDPPSCKAPREPTMPLEQKALWNLNFYKVALIGAGSER